MAKRNMKNNEDQGWSKPIRNRGEDIGEPNPNMRYVYQPESMEMDYGSQERAIRRHESRGVYDEMYRTEQRRDQRAFERIKEMRNEFYAGLDPRRRQELADGGLIREDQMAMSNLPTKAIHHEYPQAEFYKSQYIDDTIRGLDFMSDDDHTPAY